MRRHWCIIFFALIFGSLSSCRWVREYHIKSQDIPLEFVDFQDSLSLVDSTAVKRKMQIWQNKFAPFFGYFCQGVIGIGNPDSSQTNTFFLEFIKAPVVENAKKSIAHVYTNAVRKDIKAQIYKGFQHFHYFFPKAPLPRIYFYNSGYNTSLMLGENFVGASLEKFLGDTSKVYRELGIPDYFYPLMTPKNIPIELLGAWFHSICPEPTDGTLLDRMVWEGKKAYFLTVCFPEMSEEMILGYSKKQWSVLQEQEMALWAKLVEDRLLYQKDGFLISQLCEPAPFTPLIAQSTPGRAANWIAYRIIKKFVQQTNLELTELVDRNDSQTILQESQYKP